MTTAQDRLNQILPSWYDLLTQWSLDGSLVAAATDALMLESSNAKQDAKGQLQSLASQWSAGNFKTLPKIVLLSAADISGARGAYADSTDTIYLNQEWLLTAGAPDIQKVLTHELGHYFDDQLNKKDTQGDEGKTFANALLGSQDTTETDTQNENISITADGQILAAEASTSNYTQYQGSEYTIVSGDTFEQARQNAQLLGGDLAILNSQEEFDFLVSTYKGYYAQWQSLWIGTTDAAEEGKWLNVDGTQAGYAFNGTQNYLPWHLGEPNNFNDEDYGVISWSQYWAEQYAAGREGVMNPAGLNDINNTTATGYDKAYYGIAEIKSAIPDTPGINYGTFSSQYNEYLYDTQTLDDGSIVLCGNIETIGGFVAKLTPAGNLDLNFGEGGWLLLPSSLRINFVAQSSNGLVAAGDSFPGSQNIYEISSSGSIVDTASIDLGPYDAVGSGIYDEKYNKIYLAGYAGGNFIDLSFTAWTLTGGVAPDLSFASSGQKIIDLGSTEDYLSYSVISDESGNLYSSGLSYSSGGRAFSAIASVSRSGDFNTAFSGDGILKGDPLPGLEASCCLGIGFNKQGNIIAVSSIKPTGSTVYGLASQIIDQSGGQVNALKLQMPTDISIYYPHPVNITPLEPVASGGLVFAFIGIDSTGDKSIFVCKLTETGTIDSKFYSNGFYQIQSPGDQLDPCISIAQDQSIIVSYRDDYTKSIDSISLKMNTGDAAFRINGNGTGQDSQTLTCILDPLKKDPDGMSQNPPSAYTYQWQISSDGLNWANATGTGATTFKYSVNTTSEANKSLRVQVGYTDDKGFSETVYTEQVKIISGTTKSDKFAGTAGVEVTFSGSGADAVATGAGNDFAKGGIGNDTFTGADGDGDDFFDGQTEIDSINYSASSKGVDIDFVTGLATERTIGGIGKDSFAGIENARGTTGADSFKGSTGVNVFTGSGGADTFNFANAQTFGASTSDRITDMSSDDKIQVSASAFGIVGKPYSFAAVSGTKAANASAALIVYDTGSGYLYLNKDGAISGMGGGGIFAILDNKFAGLAAANVGLI